MRLFSILTTALLAVGGVAAKKTPAERFDKYHTKAVSTPSIRLDEASFATLTKSPRDYTVAVLLTAMDARFNCQLCREFQPEWDLLSRSWTKGDREAESRTLFGVLDFLDGKDVFMSLGLQTAPVLLLYQPTIGPHAVSDNEPLRYDFTSGPQTAEQVHSWVARHVPNRPNPPIQRPINWMAWITGVTSVLGFGTFLFVAWPYIVPIITSRNLWAAVTLIAVLAFTSGWMFCRIRSVPYVTGDGRGGISYFAGGFQMQVGLETQIIGGIYGILSFAVISLTAKVPRIADPKLQQFSVIIWGGVLFMMYGFLLSIFRMKNGGYPFALPPFI